MKIEITKQDIDSGCKSPKKIIHYCPIALAVKRKMNIEYGISVHQHDISIIAADYQFSYYNLPKKAKEFIKRFDAGKKVKPFTFEARKTFCGGYI